MRYFYPEVISFQVWQVLPKCQQRFYMQSLLGSNKRFVSVKHKVLAFGPLAFAELPELKLDRMDVCNFRVYIEMTT